jgi:hypothetical protein
MSRPRVLAGLVVACALVAQGALLVLTVWQHGPGETLRRFGR